MVSCSRVLFLSQIKGSNIKFVLCEISLAFGQLFLCCGHIRGLGVIFYYVFKISFGDPRYFLVAVDARELVEISQTEMINDERDVFIARVQVLELLKGSGRFRILL